MKTESRFFNSLRVRSFLIASLLLLLIGAIALAIFGQIAQSVTQRLSTDFSVRHVLWQKERIGGVLTRELALSQKMADSPVFIRWMRDENNPALKAAAFEELESYRKLFDSQSAFAISVGSGNYYYLDKPAAAPELIKTLKADRPDDRWFFSMLSHSAEVNINVNVDHELQTTRVWFNLLAKQNGKPVAVVGTGLELTEFIRSLIDTQEEGVTTLLVSPEGAIMAHEQVELITFSLLSRSDEKNFSTLYDLLDNPEEQAAVRAKLATLAGQHDRVITHAVTLGDKKRVLSAAWLPQIDWIAISMVESEHLYGTREITLLTVVMGFALVIVAVVLGLFFNRTVLSPVKQIAQSAGKIAAGDYGTRLNLTRSDEIGELSAAFDHMSQTVEDNTRLLENRVQERTRELAETNRKILEGITYASTIQNALLPSAQLLENTFAEHLTLYKPKDVVGGDLYVLVRREAGALLGVIDCTGHGAAGAMMTMTVHATLTRLIAEHGILSPAALLSSLNRTLRHTLNTKEESRLDNGLEMGLVSFDAANNRMLFAGARLSLYAVNNGALTLYRGDRQSLGYRRGRDDFAFSDQVIPFDHKTAYWLSTDGFLDQNGGARGLPFGNAGFKQLLLGASGLALPKAQTVIEAALSDYRGEFPQRDDITVIAFRGLHLKG